MDMHAYTDTDTCIQTNWIFTRFITIFLVISIDNRMDLCAIKE